MNAYRKLVDRFQEIHRLDHALTFLSWDQMVMMPSNGNDSRSSSIAEIAKIKHNRLTSAEVGDWLAEASQQSVPDPDSEQTPTIQQVSLREMSRQWQQSVCLPAGLVIEKIKAGSHCEHGWRSQRGSNDWIGFLKNFKPVVEICREEAQLRQSADGADFSTPYEALLDLHCSGDSQALIDSTFSVLRQKLPDLLQQVKEKQQHEKLTSQRGDYPIPQQQALCEDLMRTMGFDFESGRLDKSMHPFSTGVRGDLRITTRYQTTEFIESLTSTAHEVGHASYEGGLPSKLEGLPIGSHSNMCIHESQSLLFEKQMFMSKSFTRYFIKKIHQLMPASQHIDADALWKIYSRVEPGYIRVEADEVCYPLHVLLRYEIESALINKEIEADAIPEIWDNKMQSYLGLSTKGNYKDGCLQDIHWTDGAFGYFPSYTLGAVNGAQLFKTMCIEFPDWAQRFAEGELEFVRTWMGENIWSRASEVSSQELMKAATGRGTDPVDYLAHLEERYLQELH